MPVPPTPPILHSLTPPTPSTPPFTVTTSRGFLPITDPPKTHPPEFAPLESLLQRMPIRTISGAPGLLATFSLGAAIKGGKLPDLTDEVERYREDLRVVGGLYRDYTFLASAVLLEVCHERIVKRAAREQGSKGEGGEEGKNGCGDKRGGGNKGTGNGCPGAMLEGGSGMYGLGRDVLPKEIARPIFRCAEICNFKPFMEYAASYALYNYQHLPSPEGDPSAPPKLGLIRAFEHGLDPSSSEAGFVLVHVEMAQHTGPLVAGAIEALKAISNEEGPTHTINNAASRPDLCLSQRNDLNMGLTKVLGAMRKINTVMDTMWTRSKPSSYTHFRTFIFGITSQGMFPRGVLYEGVFLNEASSQQPQETNPTTQESPPIQGSTQATTQATTQAATPSLTPQENLSTLSTPEEKARGTRLQFRGESGANDSIIPLCDNLLAIPMPDTPLTAILKDFREYRPSGHRGFLEWVRARGVEIGFRELALGLGTTSTTARDTKTATKTTAEMEQEIEEEAVALRETRRLWLLLLDQVREFRYRHWCFAREYIIKKTGYPTATGGSPIVTWLPNQLGAVLGEMEGVYGAIEGGLGGEIEDVMGVVGRQKEMLRKEIERYCVERGVV